MKACAHWRGMDDEECYATWNGGQGMLLVVDDADAEAVQMIAKEFGIQAKSCGQITEHSTPHLAIKSRFGSGTVLYNA